MFKLPVGRLLNISSQFKNSFRNLTEVEPNLDRIISHVYRNTWTKNQLIQHIKENVVYESEDYIATSLPQGIAMKKSSQWADSVTPIAEVDLNDISEELPKVFNCETLILTLYPRSNASGLTIFSKSNEAKTYLKSNLTLAAAGKDYCYNFLAVVLGHPKKNFSHTFGVQPIKVGDKYATEILEKWKNSKSLKKVCYRHEVLAVSQHASLLKVEITDDVRDCVRHILGSRCLTPVLGDVWNIVRNSSSISGNPLTFFPEHLDLSLLTLDPELLSKLDLKQGEEGLIPIHVHFYSLKLKIKNKKIFFLSVPPSESFIWTCNQLGFTEIKNYAKAV